jgi:hypothetical protein
LGVRIGSSKEPALSKESSDIQIISTLVYSNERETHKFKKAIVELA